MDIRLYGDAYLTRSGYDIHAYCKFWFKKEFQTFSCSIFNWKKQTNTKLYYLITSLCTDIQCFRQDFLLHEIKVDNMMLCIIQITVRYSQSFHFCFCCCRIILSRIKRENKKKTWSKALLSLMSRKIISFVFRFNHIYAMFLYIAITHNFHFSFAYSNNLKNM